MIELSDYLGKHLNRLANEGILFEHNIAASIEWA